MFIIILFELSNKYTNSEMLCIPIINSMIVEATGYNNTRLQCDSTPNIMAWGDRITNHNKNEIVAISRDLIEIIPKNTEIYYLYNNKMYRKKVLDKMNLYYTKNNKKIYIKNSIDILMNTYNDAIKFGRRKLIIFWYNNEPICKKSYKCKLINVNNNIIIQKIFYNNMIYDYNFVIIRLIKEDVNE